MKRLLLSLAPNDAPALRLQDTNGKPRVWVGIDDENNGLQIRDSQGAVRILVGVNADERPWLTVFDDRQQIRLKIMLLPDGSPGLFMCQPDGTTVTSMVAMQPSPGFTVCDANGQTRAFLAMCGAEAALVMVDDHGQQSAAFPSQNP